MCQFEIRTWRPHGHRDRRAVDPDLERLLHGQGLGASLRRPGSHMPDWSTCRYPTHGWERIQRRARRYAEHLRRTTHAEQRSMAEEHSSDERLKITPPKQWATGVPGVIHAVQYSLEETSPRRAAVNLLSINQANGTDCPGCAWPEPDPKHRHINEYCENGAKHINDEATTRRITREFFREHSIPRLLAESDMWLNQQGRLTEPMVKRPGADHYEPISWDDAFDLLSDPPPRTRLPRRGAVLHLRPGQQRGGVPAATVCTGVGHQQPSRLQQHVSRVQRLRVAGDPRDRQRHCQPRRHPRSRPGVRRSASTRAPICRECSPRSRRPNATADTSSRSIRCRRPG